MTLLWQFMEEGVNSEEEERRSEGVKEMFGLKSLPAGQHELRLTRVVAEGISRSEIVRFTMPEGTKAFYRPINLFCRNDN